MSKEVMLPINICWGEEARKKFPLVPDDCFLVYDEWLVDTQGNIIQHCPEGGYPDGVAYVSVQLCEGEYRDYFYRTIGYGLDTFKSGMTTIYVPLELIKEEK